MKEKELKEELLYQFFHDENECHFKKGIRCELGSVLYKGQSDYKYHIDCDKNHSCYYKQLKKAGKNAR
jgi:hypothetical protein